jgi:hypothetical protein
VKIECNVDPRFSRIQKLADLALGQAAWTSENRITVRFAAESYLSFSLDSDKVTIGTQNSFMSTDGFELVKPGTVLTLKF